MLKSNWLNTILDIKFTTLNILNLNYGHSDPWSTSWWYVFLIQYNYYFSVLCLGTLVYNIGAILILASHVESKSCHITDIQVYLDNPLVQNNMGCALTETKTSNANSKSNNNTTTSLNVCISCSPTTIFV